MKLPKLMTERQAVILAVGALVIAIFLKLFAPLAIGALALIAFVCGVYAAILKWVPELVQS